MATDEIQPFYVETAEQRAFIPSSKEQNIVESTFKKFRISADDRNRNFQYFDGRNIIDFIDDSVKRYITNIDARDDLEDWQARVNDKFTRNKVNAVLGRLTSVLPIAEFSGRGDEDIRKGLVLTNLYEFAEEIDDYDELMVHMLLEAIVKGTAIGYEGVHISNRKLRDVKGAEDNVTVKEVKEKETKLVGSIVPLEEFYPSSVSVRTIKKMPYCFWRKVMPFETFLQKFGNFKKHSLVQPQRMFGDRENRPFYFDFISSGIGNGEVEVIRYYDKEKDHYVIIANGIWLNPLHSKTGREVVSALPFNHKELPFWDIKFDLFGDFFYGNSLPNILKPSQDVLNVLTNMLLDQSFLTIFPPLLTNGYDSIEDDYLRPGRRTPIDTQGLPINQAFMKLDIGTPTGWHQFILEYVRKVMEESSIDRVSGGQAGVGGRTTAQEIRVAAEGVASALGIFGRMLNYGIKRKAYLKGSNILQFWTDKKSPMIQRIGGDQGKEEFNKAFNVFKLEGATLTGGKRGTKIIELYSDRQEMPTRDVVRSRSMLLEAESKQGVEIVALEGNYLRNFLFDIKLVPNVKSEVTKDLDKALHLEKVRVYMSFFPQLVNMQELAAQTAEKMGDDPTKILRPEVFQPQIPQGTPETDEGLPTEPTGADANNLVRGLGAESAGGQQIDQLRNTILG